MSTKTRKVEVHRLTISGLPEDTSYGSFLKKLRGKGKPVGRLVMKAGQKFHALNEVRLRNRRLRLRFFSYTKGHRPDILDTDQFAVQPNPLSPKQTNIEWTHVLGGIKNGRYVLLIERNFNGIWPVTLERYLQMLVDRFYEPEDDIDEDQEPVTINLNAEPGSIFIKRIEELDRVTKATVRIVRPNPGWKDLQTELGEKAGESDAKKVDMIMTARRGASLSKKDGVIGWIRKAFRKKTLGFVAIRGTRGNQTESFNTEKLGKQAMIPIEMDDRGQVDPEDAWAQLSQVMDKLD